MTSAQRRRERNSLRSKLKRAFLKAGGTRTKARKLVASATGERRVMLRRIVAGTCARETLKEGVTS